MPADIEWKRRFQSPVQSHEVALKTIQGSTSELELPIDCKSEVKSEDFTLEKTQTTNLIDTKSNPVQISDIILFQVSEVEEKQK